MKAIHVVAAIIWNAERNQLLISRRPDHLHKGGYWEFPGGKVEPFEGEEQALRRELYEELDIGFGECEFFQRIEHTYPEKSVCLDFYHVYDVMGSVESNEGQEWRWVDLAALGDYQFPEANVPVMEALLALV